jgi:hypothetical protein
MDAATIAMLVQTLGPIVIPLLANAVTWLFNKGLGSLSPAHQAVVSPFLPVFAGAIGTALGIGSGGGALSGLVGGLAATGLHQMVTQPIKAGSQPEPAGAYIPGPPGPMGPAGPAAS